MGTQSANNSVSVSRNFTCINECPETPRREGTLSKPRRGGFIFKGSLYMCRACIYYGVVLLLCRVFSLLGALVLPLGGSTIFRHHHRHCRGKHLLLGSWKRKIMRLLKEWSRKTMQSNGIEGGQSWWKSHTYIHTYILVVPWFGRRLDCYAVIMYVKLTLQTKSGCAEPVTI